MLLKRHYDHSSGQPVLDYVEAKRYSKNQHFTQNFVNKAIEQEFLTMSKGSIILHTRPELTYKIIAVPGYFCCHDNTALGGEKEAKTYVEENFAQEKSPDNENPCGYRKDNFYRCELVENDNG